MPGDRLLALDVGTQSARAIVFDPRGTQLGFERVPYEPYVAPRPGWAEQEPEVYWAAVATACRRLWASGIDPSSLAGVALTTQRGTIVVVDAAGRPIRPAILWLDSRRTEDLPPFGGPMGLAFRALGVAETVARFRAEAEINWLLRHEPATVAAMSRYLLLSGYLTHRLTGRFVDSAACQVGYLPFDYKRQAWASPRDWKWQAIPVGRDVLPDLVPPTGLLGEITPMAAEATGIPAGLPLVAAAADRASEPLGAGALEPDVACVGFGTTAAVATTHRRYVEPIPFVPPYPAAVPGRYSLEFQIFRGFWLVEWFLRELGQSELAAAAAAANATGDDAVTAEALLDRLLRAAPPGADGLVHLPYWTAGVRFPGPEARGAFVGLGDSHGRAHLYRAMIEGLAFGLRDGLERSERRTGIRASSLRLSGGGARGIGIAQLTADVFGLPVGLPHTPETASLGAAIDAAVGLGLHPDVETAVAEMTRVSRVHEPDPSTRTIYDDLYRQAFLRLEPALRPVNRAIRSIIGSAP